jgi:hypothetical protein
MRYLLPATYHEDSYALPDTRYLLPTTRTRMRYLLPATY